MKFAAILLFVATAQAARYPWKFTPVPCPVDKPCETLKCCEKVQYALAMSCERLDYECQDIARVSQDTCLRYDVYTNREIYCSDSRVWYARHWRVFWLVFVICWCCCGCTVVVNL